MPSQTRKRKRPSKGRKDAMTALLALTEKLTESRPLEESLRAVTDAALALLPTNHVSIRLLDGSHSELLSGARSGTGSQLKPLSFRRGQGILGWVVEYKESVSIDDVAKDPRFVAGKQGFAIRSLLAEPLWSAGQVIGVLSMSSPKRRAFRQNDQLLARLLANCCTPPIERARLRRLAMTDDLTLAYNQRYLSPRVNEEIERARRSGQPLSVQLLDLDHFKNVNDQHGHEVGDMVLRLFADRVRSSVRRVDVFIRRGGEEFLLLMPATALEQARSTAERIRRNLGNSDLDVGGGKQVRQTVSIGVACWDFKESPEALQRRADVAMYAAKEQGRDRVVVSAPPPSLLRAVK
ncbi:MAG TPA: sensor domain-containing diguanylate cyclase [Polyangiaceae bacterium]|jgi:diguanylate cyclase (GGDEF)-like protein